jgi:cytoskeletal protein CcmA (bactofilin family)
MAKATAKRTVRCYLCGHGFEVSPRAMSTTCPSCHKAIKIEDVVVKSYIPVVDLQTCGRIRITKRGRVAAQRIQCGDGIVCEGAMEGSIETDGEVHLGPKAYWKGKTLQSRALEIAAGAKLIGVVTVPWRRLEPKTTTKTTTKTKKVTPATGAVAKKKAATTKVAAKKTATKKKVTATKVAAKKTATKKKVATRKAAAKKAVPKKKTAAKKVVAKKKTATKKAAAKKAPATTKTAAKKKTTRKKPAARKKTGKR